MVETPDLKAETEIGRILLNIYLKEAPKGLGEGVCHSEEGSAIHFDILFFARQFGAAGGGS